MYFPSNTRRLHRLSLPHRSISSIDIQLPLTFLSIPARCALFILICFYKHFQLHCTDMLLCVHSMSVSSVYSILIQCNSLLAACCRTRSDDDNFETNRIRSPASYHMNIYADRDMLVAIACNNAQCTMH